MALATDKQIRYIEILVEQVPGAKFPTVEPLTKKDRHVQNLTAVAAETRNTRSMGELLRIQEDVERQIDEVRAAK